MSDGRGNDSFDPRCWDCGHSITVHRSKPPGCDGTFQPCDCVGYRDAARAAAPSPEPVTYTEADRDKPGLDAAWFEAALPDALSLASEQDQSYEYSDEPGSPFVKFLAAALAARLQETT